MARDLCTLLCIIGAGVTGIAVTHGRRIFGTQESAHKIAIAGVICWLIACGIGRKDSNSGWLAFGAAVACGVVTNMIYGW